MQYLFDELLKEAIENGNDDSLSQKLKSSGCFLGYTSKNIKGKQVKSRVPFTAAETFACGEFNRFYIRALCSIAIDSNKGLVVYRAKDGYSHRIDSDLKIGQSVDAKKLLEDLRNNIGLDTALGVPGGPNSGISVFLQ